jgi:uncharacterized membrane protein
MNTAPSSTLPDPGPAAGAAAELAIRRKRRPFGLTAIIVIQLLTVVLSGLLLGLLVLTFLLAAGQITIEGIEDLSPASLQLSPVDTGLLVLTFVINGICAVGLWRRQRWAWFLTMLQLGFFMLNDLYSYFTNSPPETYVWSMLLNVAMVFYLNQREVQAVFLTKDERQQL